MHTYLHIWGKHKIKARRKYRSWRDSWKDCWIGIYQAFNHSTSLNNFRYLPVWASRISAPLSIAAKKFTGNTVEMVRRPSLMTKHFPYNLRFVRCHIHSHNAHHRWYLLAFVSIGFLCCSICCFRQQFAQGCRDRIWCVRVTILDDGTFIFWIAAHFTQTTVLAYEKHYGNLLSATDVLEQDGKECSNLLVLISELYNFQVISSVLVFDIIRALLHVDLTEFNVELLLKIVRSKSYRP